jgi:hypothetical protein
MAQCKCDKEAEISEIKTHIVYIRQKLDELCPEIKANSEMRLNAKTIVGFVSFIATGVGAGMLALINYIMNYAKK